MLKFTTGITIFLLGLTYPVPSYSVCNIVGNTAYGDCSGVNVNSQERRKLSVKSSITESAIVAGAIVHNGGYLTLNGVSTGDIHVRKGGSLVVYGVVSGTVNNAGGNIDISGIVNHLHSTGGQAIVTGQVGSFSGQGLVHFKKNSILQGQPILRNEFLPKAP
jgi:hypothetical protein